MPRWLHIGIKVMLIDIPLCGQDRLILSIMILVFALFLPLLETSLASLGLPLLSANLELDAVQPLRWLGLYETKLSVVFTRRRFLSTVLSALHHGSTP